MKILIDNGHGVETKGKRSPLYDGKQLFEFEFNRDIVRRMSYLCFKRGINDVEILTPEVHDVPLSERCRRANGYGYDCLLISVHANAGGGTGFEVFTSVGETLADGYATTFFEEAQKMFPDFRMRADYYDGDPDKESQFYILRNTIMPAILTENFFMDNPKDFKLINSIDGREKIAEFHVNAIERVLNNG